VTLYSNLFTKKKKLSTFRLHVFIHVRCDAMRAMRRTAIVTDDERNAKQHGPVVHENEMKENLVFQARIYMMVTWAERETLVYIH
jgi:hypothetical protein